MPEPIADPPQPPASPSIDPRILLDLALLVHEGGGVAELFGTFAREVIPVATFDFASLIIREGPGIARLACMYPEDIVDNLGEVATDEAWAMDVAKPFRDGVEYKARDVASVRSQDMFNGGITRAFTVPLFAGEEYLGILTVGREENVRFSDQDRSFLVMAARLLASAIRNEKQVQRVEREALRERLLGDLALMVHAGDAPETVFERLRNTLDQGIGFAYVSAYAREPFGNRYRVVGAEPPLRYTVGTITTPEDSGITRLLQPTMRGPIQFRTSQIEHDAVTMMRDRGYQRAVAMILHHGSEVVGLIVAARTEGERVPDEDMRFLERVGTLLAQAIGNGLQALRTEAEAARAHVLNELSVLLNAGEPVNSLFERLQALLLQALDFNWLSLFARSAFGHSLVSITTHDGEPGIHTSTVSQSGFEALSLPGSRTAQVDVSEGHAIAGVRAMAEAGIRHAIVAALPSTTERLGLLVLGRSEDMPFDETEAKFIEVVAILIAQAVANQLQIQRAEADAARGRLLNELSLLLNAAEPVESLFTQFEHVFNQGVGLSWCMVLTRQLRGEALRAMSTSELPSAQRSFTFETSGGAAMLARGEPVVQYETAMHYHEGPRAMAEAGYTRGASAVMRQGVDIYGLLVLGREQDIPFDDVEMRFIEHASTLLAQAVANQLRVQQAEVEFARSQLLNELSILVNAGEPVATVFDRCEALLRRGTGLDWCALLMRDQLTDDLFGPQSSTFHVAQETRYTATSAGLDQMVASGRRSLQYATRDVTHPGVEELHKAGLQRAATTPLHNHAEALGLLVVGRQEDLPFDDGELNYLEIASTLISQAISNQVQVRRAETEAARSQILNEMAILLSAGSTVEAVLDQLWQSIGETLAFDYMAAVALDEVTGLYRFVGRYPEALSSDAAIPYEETGIAVLKQVNRRVLQARTADAPGEKRAVILSETGFERFAITALASGDTYFGSLLVGRKADIPFARLEMQFLDVMSVLLSQGISNQNQMRRTRADAARSQLLNQLAILLSAGEEIDVVFERLAGLLAVAVPFDYVAVIGQGMASEGLRIVGSYPQIIPADEVHTWDLEALAAFRASGSRFLQIRAGNVTGEWGRVSQVRGFDRMAFLQLKEGDSDLGILFVCRRSPERFGEDESQFLEILGVLVSQAVATNNRVQRSQEEAAEQRLLARAAALAASATSASDLMAGLEFALSGIVPGVDVVLAYIDGEEIEYPGESGRVRVLASESIKEAVAAGQVSYDAPEDSTKRQLRPGIVAHTITISETPGIKPLLIIGSSDPEFRFRPRELRIFRVLANVLGPTITNIREAEQMVHERAQFELVLRSLSEAVLIINTDMIAEYVNPAGQPIVDTFAAQSWETLSPAQRFATMPRGAANALRSAFIQHQGGHGRDQLTIHGETRWYDFEVMPFPAPDNRVLLVAEDVTSEMAQMAESEQQRERLEQSARLAALGEIIGGVAHELNNPLTAILGFAEILEATDATAEDAQIIRKEALRARDIVRDLLFIARPGKVEQEPLHFADLVGHVERLRRAAWRSNGITVEWNIGEESGPVLGNEHQLTQVLLNLVTNAEHALESVPDGWISVRVAREAAEIVLEVSDNGTGMSEETRRRVFEPFFTTKQGHGTGLGLSMSYSIIAAHHGRIDLESALGAGTKFTVRLPIAECADGRASADARPGRTTGIRVLVVDDEPNLRRVCQRLIASLGSECVAAATATQGLELALSEQFDLILCDYRLATDTAVTIVEGLMRHAPERVERVVIATGATTDPGVAELTERYGLRLVAKPYGYHEIAALLTSTANVLIEQV